MSLPPPCLLFPPSLSCLLWPSVCISLSCVYVVSYPLCIHLPFLCPLLFASSSAYRWTCDSSAVSSLPVNCQLVLLTQISLECKVLTGYVELVGRSWNKINPFHHKTVPGEKTSSFYLFILHVFSSFFQPLDLNVFSICIQLPSDNLGH